MATRQPTFQEGIGTDPKPVTVRLPAFVSDQDIGLGDALKRVTGRLGIRSCSGCERRAAVLNQWITFLR